MMSAVEAAIIIPALVLLVGLVIVLARDALAQQAVASAAQQAARAVSVERTSSEGIAAASMVVTASLEDSGIECASRSVTVDAAGLGASLGSRATVSVTVSCDVVYGVSLPGFRPTRNIVETRNSPVDTYRSR